MKGVRITNVEKLYSVEKRKELAKKYHQDEQTVINMAKDEYIGFVVGLVEGEKEGAKKMLVGLVDQPDMVISILNNMTEGNRNFVLDKFCEEKEKGNDEEK